MAKRTEPATESVPPTLTPQRAIELIQRQLDQFEPLLRLNRGDPGIDKWESTTEGILKAAFGEPGGEEHEMLKKVKYSYGSFVMRQPEHYYERKHRESMLRKKSALESCIEQLEILALPIAQVSAGQYQFHSEIERVSGHLFRDGHYKQAALEAFIRVIEEVKQRSGLSLEGDNLMNQAFGCSNRNPVVRLNSLSTDAERDEQNGFMFLFKGIVALRNTKAHSNQLFSDSRRAHEYLALASLLLRLLEIAQT